MEIKLKLQTYYLLPVLFLLFFCAGQNMSNWVEKKAPEYFVARFETTKGNFEVESRREWSPAAVDRFYQLLKTGFYKDIAIFRVIPDYVAQFGIHNDTTLNTAWEKYILADEPVIKKNFKGTVAFARAGKDTRSTQLFINLKDNTPRLDTLSYLGCTGFPVIANVISGMDIVESFYSEYGAEPGGKQDSIYALGNIYLKNNYPRLDYINKATIIKTE
jgi:cyclophilin family peptidyl-prolyl cis-trans isomerase